MSEFKRWLEANGAARGMTDEEVETLFKAVDVDNSGAVLVRCFSVRLSQAFEAHGASPRQGLFPIVKQAQCFV